MVYGTWLDVIVSPYYMDQSLSKAREIDLIVEKEFPFNDGFNRFSGYVVVRLFVECKYIPSPSVFWFSSKDGNSARELVCKNRIFNKENSYTEKHHYLSTCDRVAKLFASRRIKTLKMNHSTRRLTRY